MPIDDNSLEQLEDLLDAIRKYDDPRKASNEWKQVYRILQKTDLPVGRVNGVVGMRDAAGLSTMIEQFRAPAPADAPAADAPDEETLRKALAAFRRRLALTVLDEESKLGRGPFSKGASEGTAAIQPPTEFPDSVWRELVRQGRLRDIGHGLFELVKGKQ